MRRPPFDPFLGQPQMPTFGKLPPTPTQRQMQMQAAHRGRGPGGWSHGGGVGVGPGLPMNVIDVSTPAGRRKHGALGQYTGPIGVRKIGTAEAKEAWANRARRQASRSPGGWYAGGDVDVDSREALMAEREMLQQQLQMADEVTAQEIMAQIMEINKELEMEARNFGMAGGGLASLMGG